MAVATAVSSPADALTGAVGGPPPQATATPGAGCWRVGWPSCNSTALRCDKWSGVGGRGGARWSAPWRGGRRGGRRGNAGAVAAPLWRPCHRTACTADRLRRPLLGLPVGDRVAVPHGQPPPSQFRPVPHPTPAAEEIRDSVEPRPDSTSSTAVAKSKAIALSPPACVAAGRVPGDADASPAERGALDGLGGRWPTRGRLRQTDSATVRACHSLLSTRSGDRTGTGGGTWRHSRHNGEVETHVTPWGGGEEANVLVCRGKKDAPSPVHNMAARTTTAKRWRDGTAGNRTSGRGPMADGRRDRDDVGKRPVRSFVSVARPCLFNTPARRCLLHTSSSLSCTYSYIRTYVHRSQARRSPGGC